jgi:hypothetical protein
MSDEELMAAFRQGGVQELKEGKRRSWDEVRTRCVEATDAINRVPINGAMNCLIYNKLPDL